MDSAKAQEWYDKAEAEKETTKPDTARPQKQCDDFNLHVQYFLRCAEEVAAYNAAGVHTAAVSELE